MCSTQLAAAVQLWAGRQLLPLPEWQLLAEAELGLPACQTHQTRDTARHTASVPVNQDSGGDCKQEIVSSYQ